MHSFPAIKKIVLLASVAILGVVALCRTLNSPASAMQGILAAVDANEAGALQPWTDLPAVQASLARQYTQFLSFKMRNNPDRESFEASGVSKRLSEELIAAAVTPAGLLELLQGNHQVVVGRLDADNISEQVLHTPLSSRTEQQIETSSPISYAVRFTDKTTRQPLMVLTVGFNGLGWKLTSVQIPMWGKLYEG